MMTLDHVGNQEAMVHAQLGQQLLVRTTVTSLERSSGVCIHILHKRAAAAAGAIPEVALSTRSIILSPFRVRACNKEFQAYHSWNNPLRFARCVRASASPPEPSCRGYFARISLSRYKVAIYDGHDQAPS